MPSLLHTAIARAQTLTSHRLLVRIDAGNDAQESIRVDLEQDVDIKRNLRRESKELWFQLASQKDHHIDDGKEEGMQTYELCVSQSTIIDGNVYTYHQPNEW